MAQRKEPSSSADESSRMKASALWKGENESDPEQVENYDTNPLLGAGAWTEDEALSLCRQKLVRLRDLYVGQLSHLRHSLQERRRQFLLQWQARGGPRTQVSQPSEGGSLEDAAYRSYRKRSGEEALLQRKQKQRRVAASLEIFSRKDSSRSHYQFLARLHQQTGPEPQPPCSNPNCESRCAPFASRCLKHICEDPKQVLYIRCVYVHPSGAQCLNPVTQYTDPPFCGAHCDNAIPPEGSEDSREGSGVAVVEDSQPFVAVEEELKDCPQEQSSQSDVAASPSDEINPGMPVDNSNS